MKTYGLTLLKIALFWVARSHFFLGFFWLLLQNMFYSGNLHLRKCCSNYFLPSNGISMNLFHTYIWICVSWNGKKHQYWFPASLSSDRENQIRIGTQGWGHNKTEGKKSYFSGYYGKLPQKPSFPGWLSWFHGSAVGDSGNSSSKDVQLKVYCRKAIEIHWSENRYTCSTLPKLCTAWLFTQKISAQIQKKHQTEQESIPGFRILPAQNMLSSSVLSCSLGSLHFFCEISLTLASNSSSDASPMGCASKKIESLSSHSCYVLSFIQNMSLLGKQMDGGRAEGCMC